MNNNKDYIPRSVGLADFLVVLTGFVHNVASSVHALSEDLMELAAYNASRKTTINKVWEDFANDLEKMEE
jgi:hypothetical protein